MEITETPWKYHTFRNQKSIKIQRFTGTNDRNLVEFTGTNILRVMVQKRSKINQNCQSVMSNIEFVVTFDKNFRKRKHPLSMVLIHLTLI